jgi:hypothetical protein
MATTEAPAQSPMELLTLIVTTSMTPSAPSTELLSAVFRSFHRHCPALTTCRVIVVFDGYDRVVAHARLKKGHVTPEEARDFEAYKSNIKKLILKECGHEEGDAIISDGGGTAEYGSPMLADNVVAFTTTQTVDRRVSFIEPSRRLGFGLAVRTALRMAETPYVWVQQHDWSLVADIPVQLLLRVMQHSESDADVPVKYVCLPAVRMLTYATSADVEHFPTLKEMTASLKRDFVASARPDVKIPLTPLFFWHDKPHVASTDHYLARVFPTRLAMMRGDFIEDKIGQRARAQMKEGQWCKWATWLYYPDEGKQLCLRHLQGRTRRGAEAQAAQVAIYREQNREKSRKQELAALDRWDTWDGVEVAQIYEQQ